MKINRKKVILFGMGSSCWKVLKCIGTDYEVVAFTDNDSKQHGKVVLNIPVISPSDIEQLDFDYIIISSMYEEEIVNQLFYDLDIGFEKIKFVE